MYAKNQNPRLPELMCIFAQVNAFLSRSDGCNITDVDMISVSVTSQTGANIWI